MEMIRRQPAFQRLQNFLEEITLDSEREEEDKGLATPSP